MMRGNALSLGMGGSIGTIEPGCFAIWWCWMRGRRRRWRTGWKRIDDDLEEELFVLMTLGDDRAVKETYVQGRASK